MVKDGTRGFSGRTIVARPGMGAHQFVAVGREGEDGEGREKDGGSEREGERKKGVE